MFRKQALVITKRQRQRISLRLTYAHPCRFVSSASNNDNQPPTKIESATTSVKLKDAPSFSIPPLNTTDTTVTSTPLDPEAITHNQVPQTLFPWVHSPSLLPRFIPTHPDYETLGPIGQGVPSSKRHTLLYRGYIMFLEVLAARQMYISWRRIITAICISPIADFGVVSTWKQELATGFAWAFQQSIVELIMHKFEVEKKKGGVFVEETTGLIDFDQSLMDENNQKEKTGEDENDDSTITSMMEPKLLELYQSAKQSHIHANNNHEQSHPTSSINSNLSVRLQTRPLSWKLENIYIVPLLTRKHVSQNPRMKGALQILFNPPQPGDPEYEATQELDGVSIREMLRELGERVHMKPGTSSNTIVAQVSIDCMETFVVRDVATGRILQGNIEGDGAQQKVTHLVRFEMITQTEVLEEGEEMEEWKGSAIGNLIGLPRMKHVLGSWVITDWDDLLDGNIWF